MTASAADPTRPDPQTQAFIEATAAAPGPAPDDIPLPAFRAALSKFQKVDFDKVQLEQVYDLPPGEGRPVPVRVYRPADPEPAPVIIWAHGGSWIRGDLDTHDHLLRTFAERAGCAVVSVDYRRAPEDVYPHALEDVHATARWAQAHGAGHGFKTDRVAIGGDSSGATLAAGSVRLARERGDIDYALQVLLLPVLDLRFSSESWRSIGDGRYLLSVAQMRWAVEKYAPGQDPASSPLSPLLADSYDALPPAVVVVGQFDPSRDDGLAFAANLSAAGVAVFEKDYAGLIHHAILAPKAIPLGLRVVQDTAALTGETLRKGAAVA